MIIGHLTRQAAADKVMTLKEEAAGDLDESKAHSAAGSQDTQVSFRHVSLWTSTFTSVLCSTSFTGKGMCSESMRFWLKSQLLSLTSCVT